MEASFPVPSEDVLAQPTRARLFALLIELKRAAETVELGERLDLHPNGGAQSRDPDTAGCLIELGGVSPGPG